MNAEKINGSYIVTSEYVSPGHPDKIADQISDAILDEYIRVDPDSKVACETMIKNSSVILAGEITSSVEFSEKQISSIVGNTLVRIGYDGSDDVPQQINGNSLDTLVHMISQQSPEIHSAVVKDDGELGAGDQGIVFGYASGYTPNKMPPAIYVAKNIIDFAYKNRKQFGYCPDMKCQVSIEYVNGIPTRIADVVFSTCHIQTLDVKTLRKQFINEIFPMISADTFINGYSIRNQHKNIRFHINPGGNWNIGGPISDCGLTGRKIVVDQYGADSEVGGGAFSGKDPSKVDRSGAYIARNIAMKIQNEMPNIGDVKLQLGYSIGEKYPISIRVFNSEKSNIEVDPDIIKKISSTSVSQMINKFNLKNPIYFNTAHMGHFGNSPFIDSDGIENFKWEDINVSY
ncbi:S-adenosylmethionine synthase [Microcystis phage Mel-JY01]